MIFRDAMNILENMGNSVIAFNAVVIGEKISDKYKCIMDEKVIHSECFKKIDRIVFFYKQNKFLKSLMEKVNVREYELIHSHTMFNGGWVAYKLKQKFKIPYIVSFRDTDLNVFLKVPFFNIIAKKIIINAAGIIFLSPSYKKALLQKFRNNTEVVEKIMSSSAIIPNGVEQFWLEHKGTPKKKTDSKCVNLLAVGKINKNKNMLSIIDAAKIIESKGIICNITIIGQIIDREVYEKLKKSKNVVLIEYLKKEKLINYYRENDIFVMPSFHESFGRVYVEALTQCLPVIYTKNQGFDGFYEQGYVGYAVKPSDINEIAEAILNIIDNYEMISQHCSDVCENFDWNSVGEQLNLFYHSCCDKEET
jgi:glycosyltransferase involved in cell wall biosynthesis